jgi:hypothetical protein
MSIIVITYPEEMIFENESIRTTLPSVSIDKYEGIGTWNQMHLRQ